MTNIWKRSISMLLALVMVVGMLPVQAFATETEQGTEAASVTEPVVVETTAPVVEEIAESSQATEEASAPEPVPEETAAATESVAETTEATEAAQETTAPAETEAVAEETTETVEEPVEETEPAQEAQIVATRECYNVVPSVELPSDEELFAAYAEQQFYGEMAAFGTAAGRRLTGDEKLAYDALVPVIKQIANGERASAKIALGVSLGEVVFGDGSTGVYNADVEVAFNSTTFPGDSLHRVVNALMTDMPYEMYWYDKTIGVSDMVIVAGSRMHIVFEFAVAGPYMGSNLLTANTAKTGAAKTAAANAKTVVDSIAADASIKTDYDKLIAYRDWICANVAYNTSAADGGNFSENADPWQLIYVFDGNAATNVVCEGYSKAFQYLCDLSEFDADVYCYSVTGVMAGGTGAGGHMWNILEIDGKHYLVDVTNSDSGTVGAGGGLFLAGGTPNADGSYTFIGVNFAYDDNTREQWAGTDVLTLDTASYKPVQAGGSNAEAALREGLAASVGKEYIMNDSVTLTEDLTINLRSEEDPWLIGFGIGHGATLTVPSGVTLTVMSSMWIEGELILEDGATLVVGKANDQYGTGVNLHGKLTAASGATVKLNNSGNIYVYDGATVSGVPTGKLIREKNVSTLAELKDAMTLTGYRQVQAYIKSSLTLAETLTIPEGFNVHCLNSDGTFTIANGGHLIVDGFFSIQNGVALQIDAGGIMTINGNAASYGGVLRNNGTINGYFQVNSAGGQELSEADFITAMENCNGYYNLVDHVVITGDVAIPNDVCVWVTDTGSLTVAQGGKLTVSENGQLSTSNSRIEINGTLVNNGYMSLDFSGDGGEIKIASAGKYQNNGNLFVGSGTLALDGTYTGGNNAWVRYDSNATITNIDKIGKENIYLQDVVHTEAELIAAMVVKDGYKGQSVSINDDITLTKNLVIPGNIDLEIGYSWRSEEENQYGLTLANGVTLTNESGIYVGEKFYLHINNGATLVNNGYVDVYGSYVCNGTVTGNAVQINGGTITQDAFEQMLAAAGENWVNMGQQVTLERNLTIDNNFSVNGPEGSIVVPSGVTLTVNGFMGVMGQVTVEAGGKIVMGENANIHVDGEGSLTFESGANLSGLRKGQIHYYPAYGATINGLDNSYVELSVGVNTMAELKAALSNTDSSYHSTHIEIQTPFDITENIVIPANVCLSILNYLEGGMVNMTLSGNLTNKGSFEIDYGVKLTVTGSLNNDGNVNVYEEGTLYVANGGSLTNNGGLRNYGGTIIVDGAYENKGHVEGNVTVNGASSVTDALQEALNDSAANGQDYVCSTTLTLDKDLTVNLNGGTFKIEEGGMIVVPTGVKLTVESNVELNGGKLIVQSGGWVQTTNGAMINAEMGVFFVETGAKYDMRANWAVIEAEGDAQTSLVAYNCNDYGSGVAVDWRYPGTAVHIMPGMRYQGLFCIREFNKTNYEWHNTIIRADELTKGEHLTAMALADTENPPVFAGDDEYAASYAVAVIADRVFAESHLSYTLRGVTYTIPVTIGPGNMGFFSQPVATAENYLGLGYTIDPDAAENSFYYMFFGDKDGWKIDSFQVVNNPFDMQPVDQVTWTKVSDTVYKITVKPEYWNTGFPVHVQVEVAHADSGNIGNWGIGQLWVEAPALDDQAKLEAMLREAAANGTHVVLEEDLTLTRDLTLTELLIIEGAELIVPSGITLYNHCGLTVFNNGALTVDGTLDNSNEIRGIQGKITVNGKYIHGASAEVYNEAYRDMAITINGIAPNYQTLVFAGNSASRLSAMLNECSAKGYGKAMAYITGSMTLPQDLKFSDNVKLWVQGSADAVATLTVPAGKTMELHGNLVIEKTGAVDVQGTLKNYGGIHVHGNLLKQETAAVFNGTFMNVYAGGRVHADGDGWSGYDPWKIDDSAIIEGTSMGMTQTKFEHWLAEAERVGYAMELSQVVTLNKNLTINADVTITNGGGIVVPKGVTLTINSESFKVNAGGSLVVDGTLVNNASFWLYKGARMDVNKDAVLNNTWATVENSSCIWIDGGELNISGTLNNSAHVSVYNGGVINVMATGMFKNIFSGKYSPTLAVDGNGTLNLMGTIVNDGSVETWGSNAKLLSYAGSKLTNNATLRNDTQDATMDLSQTQYIHGTNATVHTVYFENGSVSTIQGIPNEKILLHVDMQRLNLSGASQESVVNAFSKYGYDNDYQGQIVHYFGVNEIDEDVVLQPGTKLLVHQGWGRYGDPDPGHLMLNANVEIMEGASIDVYHTSGTKLTIGENALVVNRGNLTVFEGTELVIDGNLDTHPGATLNVLETAKLTINKSAAVVNSGVLGGEKGSHISIDGYVGNYRGEMYALGTYELSKNGEIRNSAYNGTMSVMSGFQAKDLHLDAYFHHIYDNGGATAANLSAIINTIKNNGYISGEVTVFTDMTLNTLEIPANVTLHIYGEDYNGQVVSTTTVTVNGQLTNMGKIQEHRGGKLVMNGTLVGMPPVDESGNTDFISQAELEAMLAESQHVTLNKRVIVSGELEISGTLNIVDGGELTIAKGGTVNLTGRMELFRDDSGTTPGMLNVQTGGKLVNNGEIVFHQPANEKAGPVVDVKGTYVHGITNTGENAVVWSNYVEGNAPAINGIVKSYQTLNCVTTQEVRLNEFFTFANGYGAAEVSVTGDLTLQNNLVIPVNGKLCVTAGTLTIPEGVTLSNWGAMEISEDGHLVVEGTILGNEPVVGTENTNIISLSQFKQELAETAVSGQPYNLTKRVIVTENMTLSEGMKLNIIGGELVVTNNATFTNNGVISTSTNNGGAIVVEEGSKFINNSELHVGSDGVKMAPGSYVHGEQAMLYVDYTDSGDGYTVANIEGVDKSYQILLFKRNGMWSAPAQRFFDVAQGYRGGLMKLIGGMTVEQELTVPANVTIRLGDDAFCELRITADLTNNGTIVLASGSSMSMDDCWLNNYGKLEINGNADLVGTVDNYGQLVNRGAVNGAGTIYSVPGGVTDAGSIHCRLVYNAYVTTEAELLNAVAAGVQFVLVEKDLTLTKPFTIPADVEICIREDVTVTVNMNGNITNHGWINVYGKIVFVKGDVDGYKVNVFDGGKIENAPEDSFVLVGVQPASFEFTTDKLVAPTGVPVDLFVKNVQPIGADYVEYAFEILDYDPDKAYIDQDTNMLYGWDEGPVTVRAKLILGYDENNEPIYSDITADVTVNFAIQGAYFDFPVTADDENGPVLYSGDRVVLNGEMRQLHEVTETDENGVEFTRIEIGELSNMTGTKIVWELEEDDDAYATLSVSGNKATITAKNVTERQSVTVRAMAEDDSAWTFSQSFTILPKLEKTALYTGGLDVTGKTITFDVNVQDAADLVMDMDLLATPMDALNDTLWFNTKSGWLPAVTWSSSDESIAWVGDNGALNFTGAVGTVKVTATTNGSVKKSATVTINVIETPDKIEIVEPVTKLIGSQSATYKAQGVFRKTDGTEEKIGLLNTAVKWNLVDENGNVVANDPYAVITADGKLTTKAVEAPYTISLRAEYTIGDTVKNAIEKVTLYPDVNNIEILDGTVVVNNETLLNDLGADYRQMTLAVKGYPANGSIKEVQWKSSNAKVADIDAEGKITATGEPGTVTFTATAIDHKGTRKTATVKVTYAVLVKEICLMDEAGNPIPENLSLRAGETFAFGYTAKASGEEWVPGNTNVTWTVSDTTAAGIQGTKLSAKAVNNPVKVTVTAAAKDGSNVNASCTVTILPKQADALLLYTGTAEEPVYVTKTTQLVEYNKEAPVSIQLNANDAVTWATSNAKIADVDAAGKVTVLGSGMATITAKTADGRSATVTIKGSKLSDKVEITAKNSLDVKELVVASGKSLNLTGTVLYTDGSKDAQVTWVVTDAAGNATSAAKISASGALSATANLNKTVVVYVQAMAKDGIAVSEKVAVTIKALATGVQIKNEKGEILNNLKLNWDFGGNGKEELKLSAAVISDEACQSVKWTSSGKTVADVDETGKITFLKAGTVTITATATDGSNKKATVTLVVSKLMTSLTMNQEKPIVVLGNKSLKLAPYAIVDTEATNQKLTWEILSGSDFASINATGGDLRAKDVTQMQTVTVQATAADGSGLKATATVTIYPATTKVEIWTREDKNFLTDVTGKTITMFDEEVLHLGAKTVPFDTMMNDGTAQWLWTSSDMTGSVVVDQNGVVTVIGGGVTATITAKAMDGTNKTATIKIQTIQPVERITFEQDMFLAGGMSLDLSKKVTFNDGGIQPTNKKLTWEIAREDASYASINANGMLKANKIDVQKTITVYAMATDGSNVYGSAEIALWPAATKIQIADNSNSVITKNVPMYLKNGPVSTTLNILTDPASAMQTMKWTVAATDQKYVTLVDDYGNEVAEYVGAQATVMAKVGGKTITITASTMDGTNKRATVRVQTFQLVNDIKINDQVLAGGLSLSLNTKASVNADATNKKLTWEFVTPADQQFATLSNGTLRAAKRNDKARPVTVMLRATAEDYGKFSKTVAVTILPATTKLQIMDNGVDMTNQTIDLYLGGAAGMERAVLDIQTTPAAAMQQVMWSVAERDRQYVTLVDGEGNAVAELIGSRPVVKALVGGKTVTLTATSLDGTNKKVNVKIKTTQLVTDLAIEDQILAGGLNLNLGTKIVFNEGGEQPTSKKVAWSILSGGDYASINATTGMLTAKRIDTVQKVRIQAVAQDGSGVDGTCVVTIYPATTALNIRNAGVDVTNKTIDLYLGSGQGKEQTELNIQTTPAAAMQQMKWTVAERDQQYVTLIADDGSETAEYIGSEAVVRAKVGGKTVTVTAMTLDGTNKRATVRVKTTQLVTDMTLADLTLGSGLSLNLTNLLTFNADGAQPTNKKVTWSVISGGAYASVNASTGLLKAEKLDGRHAVTVLAAAQDGSGVTQTCTVTILPATTNLQILQGEENVTNKTVKLFLGGKTGEDLVYLNALVAPINAMKQVKWSVAAADQAYVELDETFAADGVIAVKAIKGGKTVTLTAAAQDGSNKRATVRIQTVQLMEDMRITEQPVGNTIHVAAGKTMTLKVDALPTTTANKNVTWSVVGGEGAAYVTLNANGSLAVSKDLTKRMSLTIRATAKDEGALTKDFHVELYPQITLSIRLTAARDTIGVGDELKLNAKSLPYVSNVKAAQAWLWTSSNTKIAVVDEDGVVKGMAAGSATITCKAVDGSGKTATFKITVK